MENSVSFKYIISTVGVALSIISLSVIITQSKYITQLQRKYQHASEHNATLNQQISWMEQQAEIIDSIMLIHKKKLLQAKEKTDGIRKKLRQIQARNYCAKQPVPVDLIRLQHESSSDESVFVSPDPTQPAEAHSGAGT
jgi:hypothetical protein